MSSHNPNPFDFVPFADEDPVVKKPEEWLALGNLKTGCITVEMKALTPVHIVGEQPMSGNNIKESRFYKRGDKHYIPGSSIRGALRAFIEAACNGWASQLTPYYPRTKRKNQHSYGFKVYKTVELKKGENIDIQEPALKECFVKAEDTIKVIDLSSFLFGYIPSKPEKKDQFNPAWKGRIRIDDAEVAEDQLSFGPSDNLHKIPDLADKPAFMGGPHPSASSWWYQFPKEIIKQNDTDYRFIGSEIRGRKFYFHQDPVKCIGHYEKSHDWNGLYYPKIQCIKQNESVTFDIFFNDIPEQLLNILSFALEPEWQIRHKIGYAKAYGYGSVEFRIQKILFHEKGFDDHSEINTINRFREVIAEQFAAFDRKNINSIAHFLHRKSIQHLAFILGYEEPLDQKFIYPCSGIGGFNVSQRGPKRTAYNKDLINEIKITLNFLKLKSNNNGVISITKEQGYSIAMLLREIKPALHFDVYQENSTLDKKIKSKRKFNYS